MAISMRIMAVAIAVIVFMQATDYVCSTTSACTADCDVKVVSFKVMVKQIVPDEVTVVKFDLTTIMLTINKKISPVTSPNLNFDCTLRWAESDIGAGEYDNDAFDPPEKSLAEFNQTGECTLDNPKDLENGLYYNDPKTFYGSCNVTLTKAKCLKAVFLCADCPRPTSASYTSDTNRDNKMKCAYVKPIIHCDKALSCYRGEGHSDKSKLRCEDPQAEYCMAQRREEETSLFGCTQDKNYCKDKTNCCVCKKDNCNNNETCGVAAPATVAPATTAADGSEATFKMSVMVLLVSVITAMRFF
ncbi:uncharacterized protein LOC135493639 [Lineus longissimus]|uniref:uncharacterized protein LOC135493639 n=1 Tax=Lineus longissimus TaxID=88925 RepID=UPI002B4F1E6A